MLRITWRTSVRLKSTCVIITLVLPTDSAACRPLNAAVTMPPHWVSLRPVTTRVSGDRPSSAATSGSTVPTMESRGTSSGSFPASILDCRTSRASYSVTFRRRLSVMSDMNAVHWLAVARPLNRMAT